MLHCKDLSSTSIVYPLLEEHPPRECESPIEISHNLQKRLLQPGERIEHRGQAEEMAAENAWRGSLCHVGARIHSTLWKFWQRHLKSLLNRLQDLLVRLTAHKRNTHPSPSEASCTTNAM